MCNPCTTYQSASVPNPRGTRKTARFAGRQFIRSIHHCKSCTWGGNRAASLLSEPQSILTNPQLLPSNTSGLRMASSLQQSEENEIGHLGWEDESTSFWGFDRKVGDHLLCRRAVAGPGQHRRRLDIQHPHCAHLVRHSVWHPSRCPGIEPIQVTRKTICRTRSCATSGLTD